MIEAFLQSFYIIHITELKTELLIWKKIYIGSLHVLYGVEFVIQRVLSRGLRCPEAKSHFQDAIILRRSHWSVTDVENKGKKEMLIKFNFLLTCSPLTNT